MTRALQDTPSTLGPLQTPFDLGVLLPENTVAALPL